MKLSVADTNDPNSLASRMRSKRLKHFFELVEITETPRSIRILDVGGTGPFWKNHWNEACCHFEITLLNLVHTPVDGKLPIVSALGDARSMPQFATGEFDLCFSNSVIEHVGSLYDQKKMAAEVGRVAKGYFIQTPYRYFPIEPHFQFPFWAQLPHEVQTFLHQRMDLGWVKAEPDYLESRACVESCRLLSIREMRLLFPDGRVRFEWIGPFVKSLIAIRKPQYGGEVTPGYIRFEQSEIACRGRIAMCDADKPDGAGEVQSCESF